MTELNHEHGAHPAQQTPEWPEPGAEQIGDPEIASIVAALRGVPGMPGADHEAVYSELHDALLEALNEDAPNGAGEA